MGQLFAFVLQVNLLLAVLYLVYKWLMAREKQPQFNRLMLMGFYFLAPLAVAARMLAARYAAAVHTADAPAISLADLIEAGLWGEAVPARAGETQHYLLTGVLLVWIAGMVAVAVWTLISSVRIRRVIASGVEVPADALPGCRLTVTRHKVAPFSIGRRIVISHDDYLTCRDMILSHEAAHIRLHHSADLLIGRLFATVGWCNPAAWLMISELRDVHEYQADEAVIREGHDPRNYQMLLIKKAVGTSFAALANSLNHSNLKLRITMMLKSRTTGRRRLRALALAPALLAALAATTLPAVSASLESISRLRLIPGAAVAITSADASLPAAVAATPAADGKISQNPAHMQVPASDDAAAPAVADGNLPHQTDSSDATASADADPICMVNGKEMDMQEVERIDPSEIASMKIDKSGPRPVIHITLKDAAASDDSSPWANPEVSPEFPGGMQALMTWLTQNIHYPDIPEADRPKETVRVIVQFVVKSDGSVADPKIVCSGGEVFDTEALRVVSAMPAWTPGTVDGQPVSVSYTLPINFAAQ